MKRWWAFVAIAVTAFVLATTVGALSRPTLASTVLVVALLLVTVLAMEEMNQMGQP